MGLRSRRTPKLITPAQLASCYGVANIVHYWGKLYDGRQQARGNGLLLTTGAGLMMSLMDRLHGCSYAADLGGGRNIDGVTKWIEASAPLFSHIVVVAWFTASNPHVWNDQYLNRIGDTPMRYWANTDLANGVRMLNQDDLVAWDEEQWRCGYESVRDGDRVVVTRDELGLASAVA